MSTIFPLLDELVTLTRPEIQKRFSLETSSKRPSSTFTYDVKFDNDYFGMTELFHFPNQNQLQWSEIFPLHFVSYLTYDNLKHLDITKEKSFGFGVLAHVETLLAILKEEPSVLYGTIKSSDHPKPARLAQLAKMSLGPEETDFRYYLNKSLDFAISRGFHY